MIYQYKKSQIHYEISGNGRVIVLLHGFLESSTMWKNVVSQFSNYYTVVTLDFPGHGKSDVISEVHSMELMAEVVNDILKHLKIASATFVGHSMGGYVALACTDLFPSKVEKLILLNSTPAPDSEDRKENRNRALKVIEQNASAFISMAISNLFSEVSRKENSLEIEILKTEALSFPLDGIKAAIKGMRDRQDRGEVLKNFSREKFMILSEDDPLLPIQENTRLAEICEATPILIGGGHMSTVENLEEVLKTLKPIL